MRTLRRAAALAIASSLAIPLTAIQPAAIQPAAAVPAEPTAGPVTTLATNGLGPVTVVDGDGTATAVWATHYWRGRIMAARRPAGGTWSTPVAIGHRGTGPQIGVDGAGIVTVLFSTNRRGFTTGLSAVRREPGRPWGTPKHLTNDRPAVRYGPDGDEGIFGAHRSDLAVSPGGDVIAVWQWGSSDRGRPFRIEWARRPADGLWSEPRALTRRDWSSHPEVGVDIRGRATLVYNGTRTLVSRRLVPGEGWAGPVQLSPAADVLDDLVVTPGGHTTLMVHVYGEQDGAVAVMQRPPAGPWTRVRQLSPDGVVNPEAAVAVHGSGSVSVVWTRLTGRIDAVTWTGGVWSPAFEVTGAAQNGPAQLAGNSAGDLVVWWQNESLGIRARARNGAGNWTPRFGMWPDADYYASSVAAVYPDGDVLGVVHRPAQRADFIRARRVHVD